MSRELKPCGTRSAYDRHRQRGEKPCGACVEATRLTFREASAKRRRAMELPAVELKVVARAADGVGPCAMPEDGMLWDPRDDGFRWRRQCGGEDRFHARARWRTARRVCLTECPVFSECKKEQPVNATAVWAGRIPRVKGERK